MIARLIDFLLCRFASFITGVRPQPAIAEQSSEGHRVYFANHNSHGDFILLWISLPYEVRKQTRPVAGKDYWTKGAIRRFLAYKVFNMLLIERNSQDPKAAIRQMSEALVNDSLIISLKELVRWMMIYHFSRLKVDCFIWQKKILIVNLCPFGLAI